MAVNVTFGVELGGPEGKLAFWTAKIEAEDPRLRVVDWGALVLGGLVLREEEYVVAAETFVELG